MSGWLEIIAWFSLGIAALSALVITVDELRRPQHMWIMNLVWPVTALYAGPLAVWGYYAYGLLSTKHAVMQAKQHGAESPGKQKPFPAITAIAATHCGSGCTLGDIIAESTVALFPIVLTWLGYSTLWQHKIFSTWILDYILAYLLGIVFQFFTIVPMRHLGVGSGIWAAIKTDTLSLTAWQVGMYGWMAIATFLIFRHDLPKGSPVFWFMMQIAMLCGFLTSYPVNWWLVRSGVKERM